MTRSIRYKGDIAKAQEYVPQAHRLLDHIKQNISLSSGATTWSDHRKYKDGTTIRALKDREFEVAIIDSPSSVSAVAGTSIDEGKVVVFVPLSRSLGTRSYARYVSVALPFTYDQRTRSLIPTNSVDHTLWFNIRNVIEYQNSSPYNSILVMGVYDTPLYNHDGTWDSGYYELDIPVYHYGIASDSLPTYYSHVDTIWCYGRHTADSNCSARTVPGGSAYQYKINGTVYYTDTGSTAFPPDAWVRHNVKACIGRDDAPNEGHVIMVKEEVTDATCTTDSCCGGFVIVNYTTCNMASTTTLIAGEDEIDSVNSTWCVRQSTGTGGPCLDEDCSEMPPCSALGVRGYIEVLDFDADSATGEYIILYRTITGSTKVGGYTSLTVKVAYKMQMPSGSYNSAIITLATYSASNDVDYTDYIHWGASCYICKDFFAYSYKDIDPLSYGPPASYNDLQLNTGFIVRRTGDDTFFKNRAIGSRLTATYTSMSSSNQVAYTGGISASLSFTKSSLGSLARNTAYSYSISAVNPVSMLTPVYVTGTTPTGEEGDTYYAELSWSTVSGATHYLIAGRVSGLEGILQAVPSPTTTYMDYGSTTPQDPGVPDNYVVNTAIGYYQG